MRFAWKTGTADSAQLSEPGDETKLAQLPADALAPLPKAPAPSDKRHNAGNGTPANPTETASAAQLVLSGVRTRILRICKDRILMSALLITMVLAATNNMIGPIEMFTDFNPDPSPVRYVFLHLRLARASILPEISYKYNALVDLGNYCHHNGDDVQAAQCYARAIRINPSRPEAHPGLTLLQLHAKHKKYAEAYSMIHPWILDKPADSYEQANLFELAAVVYENMGKQTEAQQLKEKAVIARLVPRNQAVTGYAQQVAESAANALLLASNKSLFASNFADARQYLLMVTAGDILPPDHQKVLEATMMLPVVSVMEGQYEKASLEFPAGHDAFKALEKKDLLEQCRVDIFYRHYAKLLRKQGNTADATEWERCAKFWMEEYYKSRVQPNS